MDRDAVIGRFRELFRAHQDAGDLRDLAYYERIFAGHEADVRTEFRRLSGGREAPDRPAETPTSQDDRRLGPYRLLRELGRGGQGQVFLAEDTRLEGRRVALKILGTVFDPSHVERFRREAIAASRLDHPGICTVYEAGEVNGAHYIAMRYVEGNSLAQIIGHSKRPAGGASDESTLVGPRSRQDLFESLRVVEKAARALHEAHEAGLVHRDVKPGNIMIDRAGDPVILDFGLAHDAGTSAKTLTQTGELLGTPVYMSPEQLRGAALDRRTDVYSLGATLYECLTLARPFDAPTLEALYAQVLHESPADPRRANRQVTRDVRVVLQTAMEKDANRRYQSALAFAEDLERLRTLRPIQARPVGVGVHIGRWIQRNPWVTGLALTVLVVLTAGLIVALVLRSQLVVEQGQTADALRHARAVGLARASVQALDQDTSLALLLARRATSVEPLPESMGALHQALAESHERLRLEGHKHGLRRAVFSPDGQSVATASLDGTARLWGVDGSLRATMRHAQDLLWVEFAPGGEAVLTGSYDGTARLWDLDGAELARYPGGAGAVVQAWFSRDGTRVLTAGFDGHARLFMRDGTLIRSYAHEGYACSRALLSPDGLHVLTSGYDGAVRLWNVDGETPRHKFATGAGIAAIAFAPDGRQFLFAPRKRVAFLHDLDGRLAARFANTSELVQAEFSRDGTYVLTAAKDGIATLWTRDGAAVCSLPHERELQWAAFSTDGASVYAITSDNVVHVWSIPEGSRRMSFRGHTDRIRSIQDSAASDRVLTSADDLTARIWETRVPEAPTLEDDPGILTIAFSGNDDLWTGTNGPNARHWAVSGELRGAFEHGLKSLKAIACTPEPHRLFGSGPYPLLRVWNTEGELLRSIAWKPEREGQNYREVNDVRTTPDGSIVLLACHDHYARAFRTESGESLGALEHKSSVMRADLLPDASGFVSGSRLGQVRRFTFATRESLFLQAHERLVTSLVVRGGLVLTASLDGVVRLQTTAGILKREFVHDQAVTCAAFSPRGDRIATATQSVVRLWNVDGRLLATIPAHDAHVSAMEFSPDGSRLATGSEDGRARIWTVDDDELQARARARTRREFTAAELALYGSLLREPRAD